MTDQAIFRGGLLDGQVVAVLHAGPFGAAAAAECAGLGAQVVGFGPGGGPAFESPDEGSIVTRLREAAQRHGRLDTLVVDAAGLFASAAPDGLGPLRAAADTAWTAVRAAGTEAMIEAAEGGKLVLIAPGPGAGPHAGAARAALENLARTLSIEWARHRVRITAILPGDATMGAQVAALVAYLASPAGHYFSGCCFSLGDYSPTGSQAASRPGTS